MRLVLLGASGAALLPAGTALAQQGGRDQQDVDKAGALADAGKFQEAAELYSSIESNYPTSPLIPQATLRLGYVYFRMGEYDKAAERLDAATKLKNVTPEGVELAMSLIPQVISAKASLMKPDAPARHNAFEDAVKQFDAFLKKYPQSAEFESANYGKSVALYQIGRYDEAIAALNLNVQKFAQSETVLDSKYLLGLAYGTAANVAAQKATAKDPTIESNYTLSEKTLNEIISGNRDVALANDARFQIGEMLFVRAGFIDPKEEKARQAMYERALGAYRLVAPKEVVVAAQKARIEFFKQRRQELLRTVAQNPGNLDLANKRMPRLIDREQEKLSTMEARADQTVTARVKSGEIFFHLNRFDECRVLLSFMKNFVEEEEQKKEIAYYTALSLASQNAESRGAVAPLAARTEEAYTEFQSSYKKDPMGENLALVVGLGFLTSDPNKAIKYFQESVTDYPQGRFRLTALAQQASSLLQLERYDDALKAFQDTLAAKPEPEVAAVAEYGIGSVYQKTSKYKEAIAQFKKVRDTYPTLPQAEDAAFWHGQLLGESGDAKTAITELSNFIKKYDKSPLLPNALYYLASAQANAGQKPEALETYKKLGEEYPKSEVAPFSYLQRGQLLMGDQKFDEVIATMKELIKAYPDGKQLFQAYDLIAQIHGSQQRVEEQIATYEEFIKSKPEDTNAAQALLRVETLWRDQANKIGRFVALNDEQKAEWKKDVEASINAAERLLTMHPESEPVALGLKTLLDVQKMRQNARLITDEEVEKYFQGLAQKFASKPGTRSKILFTLASHTFEKDKAKANKTMSSAYDETQKYAPGDLDLYASSLIEQKKYEEAQRVYDKLAKDYPLPANALADPTKVNAPQDIQEAQAIILFGTGKILQEQKKEAEAGKRFAELEKLYGWSPKNLEGSYGIAASLYQEKKYDEVMKRLVNIIKASTAPPDLRAKAMLLLARSHEDQGNIEPAIENYLKIGKMFGGVPAVAAEGLWRGASLLERQGRGELPMPTPPPKAPAKPAAKPAAKPVAQK